MSAKRRRMIMDAMARMSLIPAITTAPVTAPVGVSAGLMLSAKRRPGESPAQHQQRINRNVIAGAIAAPMTFAGITSGLAAKRISQHLRARKELAYQWRRHFRGKPSPYGKETKFRAGMPGYKRRERWDPKTGYGFGPAPTTPASSGSVELAKELSRVPENKRRQVEGLARMAKDKSSPNESAMAMKRLSAMSATHGFNMDNLIKHAGFISGVLKAVKRG